MEFQSLVVREAEPSDARTLIGLIRSLAELGGAKDMVRTSARELKRAMSGPEPKFAAYLAEVDGRPAGFASYTLSYSIWLGECFINVDDVYVKETVRGSGVGRQLMIAIAEMCREQNCRARWEVMGDNSQARDFYAKLGAAVADKCVCQCRGPAPAGYPRWQRPEFREPAKPRGPDDAERDVARGWSANPNGANQ